MRISTPIIGLAWLENKIYVVSKTNNVILVLSDDGSDDKSKYENIELKGMKDPCDLAASKPRRSIFICDRDNECIWRIQLPGGEITSCDIKGRPYRISISSSDLMIVCVVRDDRDYLFINRSSDEIEPESIPLPKEVRKLLHAIQLNSGNIIIAHSMVDTLGSFRISELEISEGTFVRNYDPRSTGFHQLRNWTPRQLSVDENDNIFIADFDNDRVVLLNSRLRDPQILLNRDQHSIKSPRRLCYVEEKQQLIVSQETADMLTHNVLVYDLHAHTQSNDSYCRVNELELIASGSIEMNAKNHTRG